MKLGHSTWRALALAAGAAAVTAGCGDPEVTGLHVTVEFTGLSINQIQFAVTPAGGSAIVAQRPETSTVGTALTSPQDVLVYLPDAAAGHVVICQATGMANGALTAATGTASVTLSLHALVPVPIVLQGQGAKPAATPASTPPAASPDGGQCPKEDSALASSKLPPSKARCK